MVLWGPSFNLWAMGSSESTLDKDHFLSKQQGIMWLYWSLGRPEPSATRKACATGHRRLRMVGRSGGGELQVANGPGEQEAKARLGQR